MLDLAIDPLTGDLAISPTNDFDVRTGLTVIEQRVNVRLRILAGQWHLDPTNGQLGSHLHDLARAPVWRTITDAPRMVREALEAMDDIVIRDVRAEQDANDPRKVNVSISYSTVEPSGAVDLDERTFSTALTTVE